jgi:hypothetical protein
MTRWLTSVIALLLGSVPASAQLCGMGSCGPPTITIDPKQITESGGAITVVANWVACANFKLFVNGALDVTATGNQSSNPNKKTVTFTTGKKKNGTYTLKAGAQDNNGKDIYSTEVKFTVTTGGCCCPPCCCPPPETEMLSDEAREVVMFLADWACGYPWGVAYIAGLKQ